MFPTKTRRDVGMVPRVSEEHVCLHGKTNWWKNSRNKKGSPTEVNILRHPGTRRGTIPCSTTQVNILRHHIYFKDTLDTSPSLHLATSVAK